MADRTRIAELRALSLPELSAECSRIIEEHHAKTPPAALIEMVGVLSGRRVDLTAPVHPVPSHVGRRPTPKKDLRVTFGLDGKPTLVVLP